MNFHTYELPFPLRKGVLVEKEGYWGEAAPLPGKSSETLAHVIKELSRSKPFSSPSLQFAIDSLSLSNQGFTVPSAALLMGTANDILLQASEAVSLGFTTAKIKIQTLSIDTAIHLCSELKSTFQLRIDVNQGWNMEKALFFCSHFNPDDFDFIEEPLANPYELPFFPFPYALDDTSLSEERIRHAKAIVLKPTVLGSKWRYYAKLAEAQNVPVLLSSSFESGIGTIALARLTKELKQPLLPMGFGTHLHVQKDLLKTPLTYEKGCLIIPESIEVDHAFFL